TGGVDNTLDGQAIAAGLQAAIRAASGGAPALSNVTVIYGAAAPVTRRFVFTSGTGSARAPGAVIEDGAVAAFLGIQTSTAGVTVTPGRSVTQGTAPVMPLQDLGLNDQGVPLAGGQDDLPNAGNYADFYGTILRKRRDVTMIVLPGAPMEPTGPTAIIDATIAHCEAMQNRMVILDPPAGIELDDPADVDGLSLPTSTYTTLYYPWVRVTNPLFDVDSNPAAARTLLAQPSAFAAGIWTRTDARRNVAKAPAGLEAELRGATAFEFEVEEAEQGVLNPLGVNCFRRFPQPVVWGARTLATRAAPEWRYVPVRRTAIFIEQSIYNGIQWAVFEPNDHPLWSALRGSIEAFMDGLFRSNHFQGRTANEAYFVRCNLGDTMTQGDIDRGQVIVVVGFAPLKPAEFVVVRIQQQVNQQ
ncbi:MAG: phage tail sheath subtilisin-like domain-containing protein, partial [Pseudomonadota bacterium]